MIAYETRALLDAFDASPMFPGESGAEAEFRRRLDLILESYGSHPRFRVAHLIACANYADFSVRAELMKDPENIALFEREALVRLDALREDLGP